MVPIGQVVSELCQLVCSIGFDSIFAIECFARAPNMLIVFVEGKAVLVNPIQIIVTIIIYLFPTYPSPTLPIDLFLTYHLPTLARSSTSVTRRIRYLLFTYPNYLSQKARACPSLLLNQCMLCLAYRSGHVFPSRVSDSNSTIPPPTLLMATSTF